MNVVVTGVGGFIGGKIANVLTEDNTVVGMYRRKKPDNWLSNASLTLIQGDLRDPESLPRRCDYVVHAAAETPNTSDKENVIWESNLIGMEQLLDWSRKAGVRYFLFLSTMGVYNVKEGDCVDESTVANANDAYGASKREAEVRLEKYAYESHGVQCLTIRLPGVVGRGAKESFLPRIASNILCGSAVAIYRHDAMFNNVVHVNDLAMFCQAWPRLKQNASYTMFNVGAATPIPLGKVATILMHELKQTVHIVEKKQGHPPFTINTGKALYHRFPVKCVASLLRRYAADLLK